MRAQADAVFLSPPWGGPSYSSGTFDVSTDVGGLGVGIAQLLAAATALLAPSDALKTSKAVLGASTACATHVLMHAERASTTLPSAAAWRYMALLAPCEASMCANKEKAAWSACTYTKGYLNNPRT